MANVKENKFKNRIIFVLIVTIIFILISLTVYGVSRNNDDPLENVSSMSIEQYREIQGTSENVITRSSSVTNDLVAMDLDPNLFLRFGQRSINRPDLRTVALSEYHFYRFDINRMEEVHMFRIFIYIHVPFRYDSIINDVLRLNLTYRTGINENTFTFDRRGGDFGYRMTRIKADNGRGIQVFELEKDFDLTLEDRTMRIYSIDRMNSVGTLISRNDQTTYMGSGLRVPFIATFDPLDNLNEQIEFNFNSHVFITENTIVEVVPQSDAHLEGDVWTAGPSGWFNDVQYRSQLFFFNFNTTVDIHKIHNLRIYFEYREMHWRRPWWGIGGSTTQPTFDWQQATDQNNVIGRTVQNRAIGLDWMPNNNIVFNAISSPASERFTNEEFALFENVNRNAFDNYDHSVLFHQWFVRDNQYVTGVYRDSFWGEVRGIDITTMTFETDGQMFTARVDITQDTGNITIRPDAEFDSIVLRWIAIAGGFVWNSILVPGWTITRNIIESGFRWAGNIIESIFGWIGSLLGSIFGGLFTILWPIILIVIIIIVIVMLFRFIFHKRE